MAATAQKSKTKSKASKSEQFKPEPAEPQERSGVPFYQNKKNRRLLGLFFLLLAICLCIALISYLSTWHKDQSAIISAKSSFKYLFASDKRAENSLGNLGALVSHGLVYKAIGILAFLLVPLLGGWGFNLLQKRFKFRSWRYTKNAFMAILFGAPLIQYIMHSKQLAYGGAFGSYVVDNLLTFAGNIGTGFILWTSVLAALVYIFNPTLTMPAWISNLKKPALPSLDNTATAEAAASSAANIESHVEVDNYETKEAELFIHNEVKPQMQEPVVEEKQVELASELIFTTHTKEENEETPSLVIEEQIEEKPADHSIPLEPSNTSASTTSSGIRSDVDFEVVQLDTEEPAEEIVHSSVQNSDEPYDPSADLSNYKFPTVDLLEDRGLEKLSVTADELEANKNQIIQTLKNFSININKISATVGPTVTLYEIVPADGVRISKIRNLEDDIALSLAALGIRIIAPIPGKGTIGIEVPNLKKQMVSMRTLIASEKFVNNTMQLPIALGKKIDNDNYVADLATMPHLLMAGATGQGKSVGLNAILVSLLYKKHPSQLKFVLVDPKKVELSIYKTIEKHFLAKLPNEEEAIITDTKKVINTLNSLCIEMDDRYNLLKEAGVRNIKEYNEKFVRRRLNPQKGHRYMPFIVLVVDEFADLIMTAGKEVEMPIARLAQLARAIGIHLIIATQRPSVNVITGTIKANFPARIAFRVSAKVDSRTILDAGGAEQLIGRGDMLVSNGSDLTRLQCAFVDTPEVERIADFIGEQQGYPSAYDLPEYVGADAEDFAGGGKVVGELDQMFEQCARLVVSSQSGSTSMLQRRFNLGYNRAGRIMDQLEGVGIVGPTAGGKPREVLVKTEMELEEIIRNFGT
ncbi:MAG: hypothetical protein RL660_49 [Bacteroidota bacterium]|jgi:S-DNA-T family DNA segregation ATPase FtsK/SpoIIIE